MILRWFQLFQIITGVTLVFRNPHALNFYCKVFVIVVVVVVVADFQLSHVSGKRFYSPTVLQLTTVCFYTIQQLN